MDSVTILMSSYNGEKYIYDQITSILNQESCKIKLLIRDDGSTDNTIKIINGFKEVVLLKGMNVGINKSFKFLLENSGSSDFYAFSDQDDVWNTKKISSAIEKLTSTNSLLYFSEVDIVDSNLKLIRKSNRKFNNNLLGAIRSNKANGCTMVIHRSIILDIANSFNSEKLYLYDWWIYAFCIMKNIKIFHDKDSLISYRQHSSNFVGVKRTFLSRLNSLSINKFKRYQLVNDLYNLCNASNFDNKDLKLYLESSKGFQFKLEFINHSIKFFQFSSLYDFLKYVMVILLNLY